jgi:hypothetical protein
VNFLQLCQKTAQESGSVAGLPSFTTVAGATGRLAKLVGWVSDAWVNIQNERVDWLFRIGDFTKSLIINQREYAPATFDLSVAAWIPDTPCSSNMTLYDPDIGQADEGDITQLSWERYRAMYDRGVHDAGRPGYWAVKPDGSLVVGPKPDKAYAIRGAYRKAAQVLALDTDAPIIPEDFHMLIVGEALRLMAASDEEYTGLMPRSIQYERYRHPLVLAQTPQIYNLGGQPLA